MQLFPSTSHTQLKISETKKAKKNTMKQTQLSCTGMTEQLLTAQKENKKQKNYVTQPLSPHSNLNINESLTSPPNPHITSNAVTPCT